MTNTDLRTRFTSYGQALKKIMIEEIPRPNPSKDIRIGLWGSASSGKTTYLAMLHEALELSPEWEVTADKKALTFVRKQLDRLDGGYFPGYTEKQQEIEMFSFMLRPQFDNKYKGKIVLSFIDAPGEFYESPKPNVRVVNQRGSSAGKSLEETEIPMDIVDYLISCDGIIFLLDPEHSGKGKKAYATMIKDLILEFQESF